VLAAHEPFTATEEMIRQGLDLTPHTEQIEVFPQRIMIGSTDTGRQLRGQLEDLQKLVDAYRSGILVERARGEPFKRA
jgi:fructose-1,6-bisphosphatase III